MAVCVALRRLRNTFTVFGRERAFLRPGVRRCRVSARGSIPFVAGDIQIPQYSSVTFRSSVAWDMVVPLDTNPPHAATDFHRRAIDP